MTEYRDFVYVPLDVEHYAELVRRSGKAHVFTYIDHAVESFLERTEGEPNIWSAEYIETLAGADDEEPAFREKYGDPGQGYQWHPIFLPNGTNVRMTYDRQQQYAEICHGKLMYGEEALSPSQFASRVANNTSRNAWRDLDIKLPGKGYWMSAEIMRQQVPPPKRLSVSDF